MGETSSHIDIIGLRLSQVVIDTAAHHSLLLFSPAPAVYDPIMTICSATTPVGNPCKNYAVKDSQFS